MTYSLESLQNFSSGTLHNQDLVSARTYKKITLGGNNNLPPSVQGLNLAEDLKGSLLHDGR